MQVDFAVVPSRELVAKGELDRVEINLLILTMGGTRKSAFEDDLVANLSMGGVDLDLSGESVYFTSQCKFPQQKHPK